MIKRVHLLASIMFFAFPFAAHSEEARLSELRSLLVPMRAKPATFSETRGATPALTDIKHELRDWIESRLPALHRQDNPSVFENQLNDALERAKLFCGYGSSPEHDPCPDQSLLGYLGPTKLTVWYNGAFLIVQTAVGIQCGFDESAYAYQWSENRWQRFWQTEQNDYTKEKYFPQTLHRVLISPTNYAKDADKSEHLILTLGTNPWCSSNWQPVYYRVWQTKSSDPEPKLLLDETEIAYLGKDPPILGSVGSNDVLIEYTVGSIDTDVHNRREIRHYVLDQGKLERVDPRVLSPRDFVDEWIGHPWAESSQWTDRPVRSALEKLHAKWKGSRVFGKFIDPTLHCSNKPDLWQVGIEFDDTDKKQASEYFLIRWRPPYHFTMIDVSDHQWPSCTKEDPEADEERTLFPVQEWRR